MTKYYTVITPDIGKDGKTRFHKISVAFPQNEDTKSFMAIQIFANPINDELVLFEPKADTDDAPVASDTQHQGRAVCPVLARTLHIAAM